MDFVARHDDIRNFNDKVEDNIVNPIHTYLNELQTETEALGKMDVGVGVKVHDTGIWGAIKTNLFNGISDFTESVTDFKKNITSFMDWHEAVEAVSKQ